MTWEWRWVRSSAKLEEEATEALWAPMKARARERRRADTSEEVWELKWMLRLDDHSAKTMAETWERVLGSTKVTTTAAMKALGLASTS
jgi:hypothetical protein